MKKETKRFLVTLVGLLAFLVIFAGCAAPGSSDSQSGSGDTPVTGPDTPKDEGKLFFTFGTDLNDSVEEAARSSAAHIAPLVPTHIMITVKDAAGKYLIKREQLKLLGTGKTNQFISPAVEIPAGNYTLEEFIVLNDETIIYVAPRAGSKKAGGVTTPLGVPVTVSAGSTEDLTIEILPCQNENLRHYGYQSLQIKPANEFANIKLTDMKIYLTDVTGDEGDNIIKLEQYDGYLYMYDGAAVTMYDIADPTKPVKLASTAIERVESGSSKFVDFKVARDGIFVVYSDCVYSFPVWNRTDFGSVRRAKFYDTSYRIVQAELAGQYLYLLSIKDTSSGAVSGKLIYLSAGYSMISNGDEEVTIKNPSHMSVFGDKLFVFHNFDTYNSAAFVDAKVLCFDICFPSDPVVIDFFPGTIRMAKAKDYEAQVRGNLMFLVTDQGTLVYKLEGDTLQRVNSPREYLYDSKLYSSYLIFNFDGYLLEVYSHTEGKDFQLLKSLGSPNGGDDDRFKEMIWIDSNLYAVVSEEGKHYLYLYKY